MVGSAAKFSASLNSPVRRRFLFHCRRRCRIKIFRIQLEARAPMSTSIARAQAVSFAVLPFCPQDSAKSNMARIPAQATKAV